ncbi:MAG: hypothetical protein IJ617_02925 [Oscillospiraceae bacterium]|nr:hypothetical protein [Oscillospiraceae bacterium]
MDYIDFEPLPQVCQECIDRRECLSKGEPEWCCDECDYALLRWPATRVQELRALRTLKEKAIDRLQRQIKEIDKELDLLGKSR